MVVSDGHCSKMPATIEGNEGEGSDEEFPADVITNCDQAIRCGNRFSHEK